jgi:hypothetical protein
MISLTPLDDKGKALGAPLAFGRALVVANGTRRLVLEIVGGFKVNADADGKIYIDLEESYASVEIGSLSDERHR